jgi:catechol 2,3-dioxygenase-like lactoylglutathione lyase family enzyme
MGVELNHIIVPVKDPRAAARFLAGILGVEVQPDWACFVPIRTSNGVTIDFAQSKDVQSQHCAFLVSDAEFDAAFARLTRSGAKFYAEFDGTGVGEVNRLYGGRGVYFEDANGHLFELITRPYAATPQRWIDGRAASWGA